MSTAAELLAGLADQLGSVHPTRIAELSNRAGTVTCAVAVDRVEYEAGAMCDPVPITVTATVTVLAATTGEQGVRDLLARADTIAALIRAAGFAPVDYRADSADDLPALTFTATANGDG